MKRKFNALDVTDLSVFKNFLETNSWGSNGCPFECEYPYFSIPDMIKDKITREFLGI